MKNEWMEERMNAWTNKRKNGQTCAEKEVCQH